MCYLLVLWEPSGCITANIEELAIPLLSRLLNICRMDGAERFFRYGKAHTASLGRLSSRREDGTQTRSAQETVNQNENNTLWERAPKSDSPFWKASGDAFCVQAAACVWKICEALCASLVRQHPPLSPSYTPEDFSGSNSDRAIQAILSALNDGEVLFSCQIISESCRSLMQLIVKLLGIKMHTMKPK